MKMVLTHTRFWQPTPQGGGGSHGRMRGTLS